MLLKNLKHKQTLSALFPYIRVLEKLLEIKGSLVILNVWL